MRDLFRRSRAMQVFVTVTIVANLTGGGLAGVALPSLAHAKYGAGGYGVLLATIAAGGLIGTLLAARTGALRKPSVFAGVRSSATLRSMGLLPYLGGEAGAAAALFVFGGPRGLATPSSSRPATAGHRHTCSAGSWA